MKNMRKNFLSLAAIAAVAVASACGGEAADQADLDREMDLAMAEDSLAQLGDTASPEAPVEEPEAQAEPARTPPPRQAAEPEPEPEPVDPGPQYVNSIIEAGSSLQVTLDQELNTKTSQVGDAFTATVSAPVIVGNHVAVPAGAQVHGRVTAVQASGGSGEEAILKVAFTSVSFDGETFPASMSVSEASDGTAETVGKIGIGAAAGAILGRVIGGNSTGTVVGGAIGAAAGTAIVLGSADSDAILAQGSAMTLTVDEDLPVRRQV
jgi:hypothetical protein